MKRRKLTRTKRLKPLPAAQCCAAELLSRIKNYLGNGGLFNPEMMEHDKVRDLILDCREHISRARDCHSELSRLLIAAANTTSIVGAPFALVSPKHERIIRRSIKKLDESCEEARKVLKQHNDRTEPRRERNQ
jgi:hypothetical protein